MTSNGAPTAGEPPFDLVQTDGLLTTTRSVRFRLDLKKPVPRQALLDCVRIAQQAPTGGNGQRWHFVVVTDPTKRLRLAQLYREQGLALLSSARDSAIDDQTRRVYASAVYLAEHLEHVPIHVLPCLEADLPELAAPWALAGAFADILPATWSFMLALRSRGLGSAWTTQTVARQREVSAILGLPSRVLHVALLPVAYYTGATFRPANRPGPETITHWDEW
jgi:nitroreductase